MIKKIITMMIGLIVLITGIFSQLGDAKTSIDFIDAVSPALEGDVEEATENVVDVGTDYIVNAVYAALFCAVFGPIIIFLKKL